MADIKQIYAYVDTAKTIKKLAVEEDLTMQEMLKKIVDSYNNKELSKIKFSETYKGASEEVEMWMEKGEVDGKKGYK